MKRAFPILALLVAALLGWLLSPERVRTVKGGGEAPDALAGAVIAGLGGFRGLIAEVVWFRAERLQDEGRYAELAQLGAWLTFLEPRTSEVWSYVAWNLAYNVSVMMDAPEDRWRWVENGLKLLRDDGLRLNPGNPALCRELAWLYLSKLGGNLDTASPHYAARWKAQVESARAAGDWRPVGLEPARMAKVDERYGAQDWTHPYAAAIYWADRGLAATERGSVARDMLRQVLCQALMLESLADPTRAPRALQELETTYAERPLPALEQIIRNWKRRFPGT